MNLEQYLANTEISADQAEWNTQLCNRCIEGAKKLEALGIQERPAFLHEFTNRVRTEELKAWYSSPDGNTLFQGTSVSSLTIPCEYDKPLPLNSIEDLEIEIADAYIKYHRKHSSQVKNAIVEDVDSWLAEGLYYGVVIASKVISQAFGLTVPAIDTFLQIDEQIVDPHEITSYSEEVRQRYFHEVSKRIDCFGKLELSREEFEGSLILADISKPNIEKLKSKIMLAPIRCNEIAALMAKRIKKLIREKTGNEINLRSLTVVIYDTDTPYTYHHLLGCNGKPFEPVLPGLTLLGSSGTINAFRWLYAYRVSLVSQKLQKGSLYSEVHKKYIPYVLFGVLVPRDAEILLDMDRLDLLRYKGNISPALELSYLAPSLVDFLRNNNDTNVVETVMKGLELNVHSRLS